MNLNSIRQILADEEGATAIEYALIASVIGLALAAAVGPIGTQIKAVFNSVFTSLGGTAE